jgi:hypothetical protein
MYIDPIALKAPENELPNSTTTGKAIPWPIIGGTVYKFHKAGDVIPSHIHPPGEGHLTLIMSGSIKYRTEALDGAVTEDIFEAPAILVASETLSHSFESVVDDSCCVNIQFANINSTGVLAQLQVIGQGLDNLAAKIAAAKLLTVA